MSRNLAQSDSGTTAISEEPVVIRPNRRPTLGFLVEQWAPTVLAVISGYLGWHFGYLHLLSASWASAFLDRVLTMVAIIIGYLIAVIAILPAVDEKMIIRKLKEWGYFQTLVNYFGTAIWSSFLLMGVSVFSFTLPYSVKANGLADGIYSALWWFLFAFVVAAIVRSTRLLLKLITSR
jgi:hypothetical protein